MSTADDYRTWLRKFPKEPAARMATALAAVDAFENCQRKRRMTAADLRPLVLAASSPHKLVFETGCNLLVQLAALNAEAQACFLEMAKDKNATVRFHAVAYLSRKLPEPLRLEIVAPIETATAQRMLTFQIPTPPAAKPSEQAINLAALKKIAQTATEKSKGLDSYEAHFIRRDLPDYFRLNQAIHKRIVEAARNPVLAATHENLNARLLRARYLASQVDQERWAAAMREHESIIDALVRRSLHETADLLLQHLRHKYETICQHPECL